MRKLFEFIKKNYVIILLVLLLMFHVVNNVVYLKIDTRAPSWDEAWHKTISLSYYNKIIGGVVSSSIEASKYPPLFHIFSIPLYFIFGTGEDVSNFTNTIFLAILIISVYLIGKRVYSRNAGLLAAFLVSMYPLVFGISRLYLIDLSVAAFVSLFFYLFIRFEDKMNWKNLLLLLFCVAVGVMLKQIFIVFIILPFIYILIKYLYYIKKRYNIGKLRIIMFLAGVIAVISLISWYYLRNFSGFYLIGVITSNLSVGKFFINLWKNILDLMNIQISFVYFLLFIFSFAFIKRTRKWLLFIAWIIFPLLFLSYTHLTSEARYLMPIVPAIAVLSACAVFSIKNKKILAGLIILLLAFSLVQYFDISYSQNIHSFKIGKISLYNNKVYLSSSAIQEDWQIDNILGFIESDSQNKKAVVEVNADIQRFNQNVFAYFAYKYKYYNLAVFVSSQNPGDIDNYIITKTGNKGNTWRTKRIDSVDAYMMDNPQKFILIKKFILPDNSEALIYKVIKNIK